MKVYATKINDESEVLFENPYEIMYALLDEREAEVGDKLSIEIRTMSREEFENVMEFEGVTSENKAVCNTCEDEGS